MTTEIEKDVLVCILTCLRLAYLQAFRGLPFLQGYKMYSWNLITFFFFVFIYFIDLSIYLITSVVQGDTESL